MAKKNAAKAAKTIGLAELAKIIEKMRVIENAHQVMIWNVLVAHNTFDGVTINASDLLGKAALLTDETPHAAAPPDEAPNPEKESAAQPDFFSAHTMRPYIDHGVLGSDLKPAQWLTLGDMALVAHNIKEQFKMNKFWPVFEQFWGVKNLRSYYSHYANSPKAEKILRLLSTINKAY